MKQLTINKTIESEVELIMSLAKQAEKLRKDYPECWKLIAKEFQLRDYPDREHIKDDEENIKLSLYTEIVRQNTKNEGQKLNKINSKLAK